MKKLIIPFLIAVTLVFQACEPTESVIYDGSQTLAYFDGVGATLEVEINSTGEITIPVNVSTLSGTERNVSVSAVEAASSATSGQYSFNGTVTIPANTYFGSMTLTGIDDGLTTDGVVLILQIDSVDGGSPSPDTYQVRIVEICPIDASFAVGDYTADWQSGGIPAAGFAPLIGNGETVTVQVGAGSTERFFRTKIYPTFSFGQVMQWTFGLICEEIVTQDQLETETTGVACNPNPAILIGGAGGGSYTTGDDTKLTLVFIEDLGGGSCGTEASTTIELTKQ
jgi:hypothetical protein